MSGSIAMLAEERLRRQGPQTQEECCRIAALLAIAALGALSPEVMRASAIGLAEGLFGEAFQKAGAKQREKWIAMAAAALRSEGSRA